MASETVKRMARLERQLRDAQDELVDQIRINRDLTRVAQEHQLRLLYVMQKCRIRKLRVGSPLDLKPVYDERTLYEFYADERETFIEEIAAKAKEIQELEAARVEAEARAASVGESKQPSACGPSHAANVAPTCTESAGPRAVPTKH